MNGLRAWRLLRMSIKWRKGRFTAAVAALSFVMGASILWSAGCGGEEQQQGRMKVAATIQPLADFCRNVGGELVEVKLLVPSGASPHTFEPTVRQMRFISDADVFVYNGLDLETWITNVVKKAGNDGLVEVAAAGYIPEFELIEAGAGHCHGDEGDEGESDEVRDEGCSHERDESHDHEHGVYDTHVWLDPDLAVYQVEAIRDGFAKADPDNEETYAKNAEEYIAELKELGDYVKGETSTFTRRKFVSFHPAFVYYAHRYGLEQVGVIEELPGKEPSAGEIADLVNTMKEQGVQVIFTEPQFSPRAAEAIAVETGAEVVLKTLDPLGNPDDPEVDTYVKLMKHNTGVMAEAMK